MRNIIKTLLSVVVLSGCISSIAVAATTKADKQVGKSDVVASASKNKSTTTKKAIININTADSKALQTVKGIGAQRAEAIVSYRDDNGRFKSINDLTKVSGISSDFIAKIKGNIKV